MNILFSSTATVEYCNKLYYNNALHITLSRYKSFGKITCLCHLNEVHKSSQEKLDDENVKLSFVKKVNSAQSLFFNKNDQIIKSAVINSDACIVHLPSFIGLEVIKYAREYNKPYLTVLVGCTWDAYWNLGLKGKLIAPYSFYLLRRAVEKSKYTIYVTDQFLQNRYPTKGKSIGCSNVELDHTADNVIDIRLDKIAKTSYESLKIGTLGAVNVKYKGQEFVIRAIAKLLTKGKKIEYHLGGGGDNSYLKSLADDLGISSQVIFHGNIPRDKVMFFLDSIDIYIQPSKQEGLPRALIEAMSRGCPALGSRTAGIPELLDSRCIFPKGNVSKICNILSLFYEKEFCLEQAKINFEKAKLYESFILNKKRSEFILEFIDENKEKI